MSTQETHSLLVYIIIFADQVVIDPTFFGIFVCGPMQSFVVQLHLKFVKIPTSKLIS